MSLHSLQADDKHQRFTFYVNGSDDNVVFTKAIRKFNSPWRYELVISDSMSKERARKLYAQLKVNGAIVCDSHNNHHSHYSD